MKRIVTIVLLVGLAITGGPALATGACPEGPAMAAATTAEPAAPAATKLGCVAPAEFVATATVDVQGSTIVPANHAAAAVPKVVFQLNKAEDAPTILRFVTNYLAVEPTAQVAVVGYAGGIDFMLRDARDTSGKPYADQVAALAARGVAFKACNNTLKARNLTAEVVSPPATVVPGAVNEIIRLQTREGYAYFQN